MNHIVDKPDHYTVGGFEALHVIKAKLTPEEYRGFLKGSILKYMMRSNYKGSHDTDCSKARFYAVELEEFIHGQETEQQKEITKASEQLRGQSECATRQLRRRL